MATRPIISVRGLGKQYHLGGSRAPYQTLRDALSTAWKAPLRYLRGERQPGADRFWALKDVSFDVMPGEVLGVVGRNGAGKSTLLKMLSRITEPTTGGIDVYGRVGSLLEVGTGFHGELSGRENIYLNGAILGMTRAEIRSKFPEIVDFAEVSAFLDTPVKHYSSGMYMRLAFAVAAHLQPEILVVDEVLAVGDVDFQKKCIGRMERVAKQGKTVILVTHHMGTVRALCKSALLLEGGQMKAMGSATEIVNSYLASSQTEGTERQISAEDYLYGLDGPLRLTRLRIVDPAPGGFVVYWRQPIRLVLDFDVVKPLEDVRVGAGIKTMDGAWLCCTNSNASPSWGKVDLAPGKFRLSLTMRNDLKPGFYKLALGAHREHYKKTLFMAEPVNIQVLQIATDGSMPLPSDPGIVNGHIDWGQISPLQTVP